MPQPIEEGMVLGGRYLVTGHVLTSADQDLVLQGRDQVLNRAVTILVASSAHASQVAASARELATGERHGSIQILDLGLSEGRTYLIAGGSPQPDDLLDLTREQQVYVEPFQTDTLGSEIFGEARTYEPHVYEDDEEYYEDLDETLGEQDTLQRRPGFLKGISERLSQRLGTDDAARDAVSGAGSQAGDGAHGAPEGDSTADAQSDHRAGVRRTDDQPLPENVSDDEWTGAHDEVAMDPGRGTPPRESHGVDTRRAGPGTGHRADQDAGAHGGIPAGSHAVADGRIPGASTGDVNTGEAPRADVVDGATAGAAAGASEAGGTGATGAGAVAGTAAAGAGSVSGAEAADRSRDGAPGRPDGVVAAHRNDAVGGPRGEDSSMTASERPKVSVWTEDEDDDRGHTGLPGDVRDSAAATGALAAGAAGAGTAAAGRGAVGAGAAADDARGAGRGEHGDAPAEAYSDHPDEDDRDGDDRNEDTSGGARWILGGILVLVLALGAVFAFNVLGNSRGPVAGDGQSPSTATPTESPADGAGLPTPQITGVDRVVPDNPGLSAETDGTLPNAIDGNPATAWQTYSFAQPVFGGYASSMALVVELEEPSAISQVDITQNSGSGGSFSVLLNDTADLDGAQQIAEGSFTGPQISVPVSGEDGGPAEAQYVIINFTELPRLSNATANLPYGLRIAEVEVQ